MMEVSPTAVRDSHDGSFTPKSRPDHTIGFAEFGASSGFPVLHFHGLPGSRFEALMWDKTAKKLNIRLIALDRPGMGLSTHDASRVLADYPRDVSDLVQHLQLEEYAILSVSGGGPYAIACAAQRGTLLPGLQTVGVVAGLGPRDLTQKGMGVVQKLSFIAMDWIPGSAVGWFWDWAVGSSARNPDPEVLAKAVKKGLAAAAKGPDKSFYEDEDIVHASTESLRGAFMQGSKGYVREAEIVTQPWGFNLETATGVKLWYGEKDELAPWAVGEALAAKIPGAVLVKFDGETHAGTALRHQERILKELCGL